MEPFVGQIQLFPYSFAPTNWSLCEGQVLQIQDNPPLFSLIGTQFGGDGQRTFALPDLRGKEPSPDVHYCIATQGIFPQRS